MLRELTKHDWLSMLAIPTERIPSSLILWGTRNLKSRYDTMREFFYDVLEVGSPNGIIEDVLIGKIDGTDVAYASVYGAPMASEITHIFGVLGTSKVIQIGTCGGLDKEINAGDLFITETAYCGEGASQYYKSHGKKVEATIKFHGLRVPLDIAIRKGQIYTTSALFAEGEKDIKKWSQQGFSAVDMETAATFSVAEYFGMERGSILNVFDNPSKQEHIMITDSEKTDKRKMAQQEMIKVAFSFTTNYEK